MACSRASLVLTGLVLMACALTTKPPELAASGVPIMSSSDVLKSRLATCCDHIEVSVASTVTVTAMVRDVAPEGLSAQSCAVAAEVEAVYGTTRTINVTLSTADEARGCSLVFGPGTRAPPPVAREFPAELCDVCEEP